MVGMGLKGGAPLPKKKIQNSFSKYLKSLTPDKQTSTRKEFKNFAASTTPMNQRSELEPNANNFSPKDLNEAVSSNNLSKQSSESLADSPSKNTTSARSEMLSKALVEVPIKAKVECVRTQKNSQAYKKTSCAKQDFVCRSKETFFQLELSCSARSMFAFLTDLVTRFLQDQGWFG